VERDAIAVVGVDGTDGDDERGGGAFPSSACSSQAWASLVETILRSLLSNAVHTHKYMLFSHVLRESPDRAIHIRER